MTSILLIDLSSIAHPMFHVSASDPDPNATSIKTVERVRALASGQPHVAVCTEGGRSFRKDLSTDYKATRPEHDAALQHQIKLAIETLKGDGFPIWSAPAYEADDIIGSAVRAVAVKNDEAFARSGPGSPVEYLPDVLVASADKDLLQLVGPRVKVHALTNGTLYDADAVKAKYGVAPDQFVDFLALVGDTSDNIKGAKGIGPKTAAGLLQKYGNLEDLYDNLTVHGTQFTPALATSLREFQPRLPLVRELIRLKTDAPIDFSQIFQPRIPADTEAFGGDDIDEAMPTWEPAPTVAESPDPVGGQKTAPLSGPSVPNGGDSGRLATQTLAEAVNRLPTEQAVKVERAVDAIREAAQTAQAAPGPPIAAPASPEPAPAPKAAPEAVLVPYEATLEPANIEQAIRLAKFAFESRLFSAFGSAQAVLMVILAGREYGMGMMASLRGFMIVEGKPTLAADLIRALVIRSGKVNYFRCLERTPERATFESQRDDDPPLRLTYTIEEARQAGLVKPKSGWERNPSDMLIARASSKLARLIAPDVIHGIYSPEELE